jgi:hypothetical protein
MLNLKSCSSVVAFTIKTHIQIVILTNNHLYINGFKSFFLNLEQ